MKRSWFASGVVAAVIVGTVGIGAIGVTSPAAAAPPTSAWSGSGSGNVANVTTVAATLNVAGLGVAVSNATADSTVSPPAKSSSSNISATAAGLPISVSTNSVSAPPDAGPTSGGIAAAVTGLVDIGAITTTNEAHWSLPAACNTTGVLSAATTQTAGLGVLPALGGGMVSLGVSHSSGTTSLSQNAGLNYGIKSVASGNVTGLSMLGGAVTVNVQGNTTLTATASGTSTGTVNYVPAVVTVTANGSTTTLNVGAAPTVINIALVGSVTLQMKAPVTTVTSTSATTSVSLLSVSVALLGGLTRADVDVLPLKATATAPSGGIDCPPPAPVITAPTQGQVTSDPTPAISGTAVPGATVNVSIDGGTPITTTADGSGNWTVTSPSLPDGSHTVNATQTVNGQTGPASANVGFTVDTTAPPAPLVVTPANGSLTNNPKPPISGTAEANSTVTVSIDGTAVGTAPVDGSGNWSFTPTTAIANGSHTVDATATDAAGNVSAVSNTNTFTVDSTPPAAPVVATPANGSSTDNTKPPITGTADANTTVTVSIDGTTVGTAPVDGSGNWTFTPTTALADGSHTVNATATDAAGNVSPVSNTNTFTVDTVAPAAPVVIGPADGSTVNSAFPTFSGTGEPGATVQFTVGGVTGTATVDATGHWSGTLPTPLTDGAYTVSATQTDAAGNTSPQSNTNAFTVDTSAPGGPVVVTPANGSSTQNTLPQITGTAGANNTVTVSIDNTVVGTTTADATGNWTFNTTVPLSEGVHSVTATQIVGGVTSAVSNTNTFTVDTTAPLAPTVVTPADGSITNNPSPQITGTAEPNSTVTVSIDSAVVGTVTADASGNWTFVPVAPLADGAHQVNATATDAAGNVSPASNTNAFTVDTVAPGAPIVVDPANGSSTKNPTPTISGTGEPGSIVSVRIDGAPPLATTATVDVTGHWSLVVPSALSDGPHTVNATAADAAGNVSPVSNTNSFTIDTVAPAAPIVVSPVDNSSTNVTQPPISGTAEANSTVTVSLDGSPLGTTTTTAGGTWTLTPPAPLAQGTYTVNATATDAAGNVSPVSNTNTFTIDTTAPAAPIVQTPADGSITNNPRPQIAGTAEANSTVTVSIDGVAVGTATADATGSWTFTPTTGLSDATHTVNATATDAAGNVSPVSNTNTFTIDTAAPLAPVVQTPADGSISNVNTPTLTGTAEAGSTVDVFIDGNLVGTVTAVGGTWSLLTSTPLTDGLHHVNATATDAAGNQSPVSNTNAFTIDTVAPAAPVVQTPANGSTSNVNTPTISGTAVANTTVTVYIGTTPVGTVTATAGGTWSLPITTPMADGTYSAKATATDAANNTSPFSNVNTFTIDTVAPVAPVVQTPIDGSITNQSKPAISGTAEPGSTVTVRVDATVIGTAPADATTGAWTLTPTTALPDGLHHVNATATDAAGNQSPVSNTNAFTIDTVAPAAPIVQTPTNGLITSDNKPTISGTADPGTTVTVKVDGNVIGTASADAITGAWTLTPTAAIPDGQHSVNATATDAANNQSLVSNTNMFTVDTVAPAAPLITSPANGSSTNDPTPAITGTAEAGSTVTVTIDGTTAGTTTADSTGHWTFTPTTPLTDGSHTVTATATDAAGNKSPDSTPVSFIVDTAAPAAPVITSPTDGSATTDTTPPITGTAEADSTVTIIVNGTVAGTTKADGQGNWTYTPTTPLPNGTDTITATATDAAGNIGPASTPVHVTVSAPSETGSGSGSGAGSGSLPSTGGGDMLGGWVIGALLIALGIGAVRYGRRRVG